MIDIDAHHGNGTQAIFWDDADVLTGSVHVDPGAGWFPHFLGFEDERGARRLEPQRRRWRRAPATSRWLEAVRDLADVGARGAARRRSSWRSAWTPPAATPRARSR